MPTSEPKSQNAAPNAALSAEDAVLLAAEARHARAHATLIHIYDPSSAPGGAVRFKAILAQIEGRLHLAPRFRQKLMQVPLGLERPYWADDEEFDVESHVSHLALPAPGDWRQFCILASRIHARPLATERSPWEIHVVEGLGQIAGLGPGCFALLTKVHHALIDANGATDLTALLHDATARVAAQAPPQPWFPQPPPRLRALAMRLPDLAQDGLRGADLLSWPVRRALGSLATVSRVMAHAMFDTAAHGPVTRFNAIVSARRVFETRSFELAAFRGMRRLAPGASVNDCILAVCGGALRRYLQQHAELPESSLSAIVPYLHKKPSRSTGRIGRVRVDLGTGIADAAERLAHIRTQTAAAGLRTHAVGARALADAGGHASSATLALSGKVLSMASSDRRQLVPLGNCAVINVPGPSAPLYLAGARLAYFSGLMPVCDGMGLVLAATSCEGRLTISATSCREQMPDPAAFAECLQASFDEYLAAGAEPRRKPRVARGKAPVKPTAAVPVKVRRQRGAAAG